MLGKLVPIKNLDQKTSAAATYVRILVVNPQGKFETLLLTNGEIDRVRNRVKKNPEDEINPIWSDRLISFLGSFFDWFRRP